MRDPDACARCAWLVSALQTEVDSRPLVVERKRLYFNVRENSRGRFLKIAEVNRQKRSTVIIPQRCGASGQAFAPCAQRAHRVLLCAAWRAVRRLLGVVRHRSGWVQMRDLLNEFIAAAEKANPGSSKAPPARAPKPAPARA